MIDTLRLAPPRVAAATNDPLWIFHEAPRYYGELGEFVQDRYRLAARFGRYDVFLRRDVPAPSAPPATSDAPVARAMIRSPVASYRRQAIRRLGGQLPKALPEDPVAAILTLRALRDGGDIRSSGLVLTGLRARHPRIRGEARGAARTLSQRTDAARHRWAKDFPSPRTQARLAPYRARAELLQNAEVLEERELAAALLAPAEGSVSAESSRLP